MNAATERLHTLYDLGLAYIRSALRAALAEVDAEIAAAGILHPAWPRRYPPPDSVSISVMPPNAPVVTVEFTGREIQDCWCGVHSTETARKIRSFAVEYRKVRSPSNTHPRRRADIQPGAHSRA
jgi:hypothetical protein